MKRTIVLVVAIVALLLGIGSVVLGAVGIAVFGTAGRYSMNVGSGSSDGAAIYVSGFQVSANSMMSAVTGIKVEAVSNTGKPLFLGAGPPSKVQDFCRKAGFRCPRPQCVWACRAARCTRNSSGSGPCSPTPGSTTI